MNGRVTISREVPDAVRTPGGSSASGRARVLEKPKAVTAGIADADAGQVSDALSSLDGSKDAASGRARVPEKTKSVTAGLFPEGHLPVEGSEDSAAGQS